MSRTFPEVVAALERGELSPAFAAETLDSILEGKFNPTQVASFMVSVRVLGETPEIIAACAKTLRKHMIPVSHGEAKVLDTCGTGGDGSKTVNLSTGAAIIASAAGAKVAKHGNRAATSQSGSADVFEELGVALDLSPEKEVRLLRDVGLVFLFAQVHHPALRHVGPARKELGLRTMFNCMGPLANPARATHQLLGAYDHAIRPTLAKVLGELGVERAWVIRSEDGMDEVSPYAATKITELSRGAIRELSVVPEDFGLAKSPENAVLGGTPAENAEILRRVLRGEAHPSRDAFLLNAAASLVVYDECSLSDAIGRARSAIESGAARAKLETLEKASKEP